MKEDDQHECICIFLWSCVMCMCVIQCYVRGSRKDCSPLKMSRFVEVISALETKSVENKANGTLVVVNVVSCDTN
jgi:hypothetical protein